MARDIYCIKLQKHAPGLDHPPFPGAMGQRIFEHISKEAWQLWLQRQTQLINENRLVVTDEKSRQFLASERETFLFGDAPKTELP